MLHTHDSIFIGTKGRLVQCPVVWSLVCENEEVYSHWKSKGMFSDAYKCLVHSTSDTGVFASLVDENDSFVHEMSYI